MATGRNKRDRIEDPALKELRNIRNLLVVLLIKFGANSDEVDSAVRMGAGNLRGMFPFRKVKKATVSTRE